MKAFELYEPASVAEATQTLTQLGPRARVLGGGSDLVGGIMKDWVTGKGMPLPDALIDRTTIPDLEKISVGADGARIGATATLTDIAEHADLQQQFPLLTQAVLSVASPLIRNFGTLGGNINQRPRCWFFRGEGFNCYKKGGDFCFAVTRDNYFHGPREDVLTENVLKPDEILLEVQIPAPAAGTRMGWTKIKDRQVYDFALSSVAVGFSGDGSGVWQNGRVVLGGVAPVPYRATVVEDALKGKDVRRTGKAAAAQIRTVARPMSLNGYKIDLAQGIIERTLLQALG